MRYLYIIVFALMLPAASALAQLSVNIGLPAVDIGINVPAYPNMVPVPGYPVYYAPGMNSNYFFYDGMYWVFQNDNWYASTWYNGPWSAVAPDAVPLFILRVPVRYYRAPPAFFRGWAGSGPPQWGAHWGNGWAQQHSGWDKWNRASVPRAAPLPAYQKTYSGNKYPPAEQQHAVHTQNYKYQPKEPVVQQHYQARAAQAAPARPPEARPQGRPAEARPPVQQQARPPAQHEQAPKEEKREEERR